MATEYALSLKQPWAALLAHGLKTIEVRRWPTRHRGRLLIHAARIPDERPEAWAHVTDAVRETAQLNGGVIGVGQLMACIAYRSVEAFRAHQAQHLNDPSWFQPPRLYGFVFKSLSVQPFRVCPGWMRIFPLDKVDADT